MEHLQRKFNENDLEIFKGNLESRMKNLVGWIDKKVKRVQWGNEEISQKFTKRSAQEILTDGSVGFMNPCNDLTLVAWALLKKNKLNPELIAKKIKWKKNNFVSMHFALEFMDNNALFSLEFATKNQAILSRGEYIMKDDRVEMMQMDKIKNDIGFDQNMESVLTGHIDLTDFNFEKIVEQLQKDNTLENYSNYNKSLPNKGTLYLDLNI